MRTKLRIQTLVAVAENGVIGNENQLIWHLPEDLRRFKRLTFGRPIIMGRKTFEAIGKPLPGRTNIILSRNLDGTTSGIHIARTRQEAIEIASRYSGTASVIGGEQVYRLFADITELVHLTRVMTRPEGDAYFEELNKETWQLVYSERRRSDDKHLHDFIFESYTRR